MLGILYTLTPGRPIRLLYFAVIRDRMGISSEEIELPEDVRDVRDLARFLEASRPALTGALASVRFAVGDEFAELDRVLEPGAVVALIPPVSGG
jgi:molybdopterin converting factor subunit 1